MCSGCSARAAAAAASTRSAGSRRSSSHSPSVEVAAPAEPRAPWHPGRTAEVRLPGARRGRDVVPGAVVGHAGELHPRVVRALGLPERACALEIDLEPLLEAVEAAGIIGRAHV